MRTEDQKSLIEQYLAAYNSFDVEGMSVLVHPQIVFKNVSEGEVNAEATGIEQFVEMANQSKEMFSEREQKASNFSSDGVLTTVDIAYEGTLAMDLLME